MFRNGRHLFTSESVTEGHPDKVADQISDAVLDAILAVDPSGRVACETLVTTGLCLLAGEITAKRSVDLPQIVRETIREIGYDNPECGFDYKSCAILTTIDEQSRDIAMGVDTGGAGDQGLMFGYACRETESLMPMPIMLAHQLARRLSECRRKGILDFLRPDGKSQVTVEYEGDRPLRVDTVVVSCQHDPGATRKTIEEAVREMVIAKVIPAELLDARTKIFVNPTGKFVTGGPHGDAGLTGRKIIVDTYGGFAHHGGGAFSGKDPTKVDRSATYMCRHVAKNLVSAGLADRLELQLAYAIGVADPVSVMVDSFGTGKLPEDRLAAIVREHFPLTPRGIIQYLDLQRPVFRATAAFGHFGRSEPSFTWESTSVAETLARETHV
jgi:S-adenosylmethionine synthetase